MAKGSPDYSNVIDLKFQTLASIANRPVYGGAVGEDSSGAVANGANVDLFTSTGEGRLYGAMILLYGQADLLTSYIAWVIDSDELWGHRVKDLRDHNPHLHSGGGMALTQYDTVAKEYFLVSQAEMTYESEAKLKLYNFSGGSLNWSGSLFASLV